VTLSLSLLLTSMLALSCFSTSFVKEQNNEVLAQPYVETVKYRNLVIDLGNGIRTNAQFTYPAIEGGNGTFPAVLLLTGSGANDMNETGGYIRIDNQTGSRIYPSTPFFQIAEYLSERGFATLRYDKRGIGTNHTILDSNVWGNVTLDDLKQDADKALAVLMQQPEVDSSNISILGHSEGTTLAPRVAIDNPDKVKNIVLMGALAQNMTEILSFQTVTLPVLYAKEVLDKNHNGSLSVQEASQDQVFQALIGGNISLILTENLPNGAGLLKSEYNLNKDAYIHIDTELKPALEAHSKSFFSPSSSDSSGKCTNLEGCPIYERSFLAFEPNINIISKVPSTTSILILQGENDTATPLQEAFLLQQRLTEIRHPDHTLITYPNLGHNFYPSSQWQTSQGPIQEYVLRDLYLWLESHSGFTSATNTTSLLSSANMVS
jgi:alpha-beta hydrolase superfamily lysophospholipase